MRRRIFTALAAAVLVGASLQAPFAHVHPEDPDHHHATGLAHTHLAMHEHETEGLGMEPHDDDALTVFLDWAPAAAQRIGVTYVEAPAALTVEPAIVRVGSAPEFRPRAHSPPAVRLLPARAPPL